MDDCDVKELLELIKTTCRGVVDDSLKNYMKIITGTVISVASGVATVRIPFANSDGSEDFTAKIVTSQTISAGDAVNIGYWSNLSTAIIISK